MTTKRSLAEQARRIIGRRQQDAQIDERELILSIEQALAYQTRVRYFENKADEVPEIDGTLTTRFSNILVVEDSATCEFYAELPGKVVDIPHGLGIRQVSPQNDVRNTVYRETIPGHNFMYSGITLSEMDNYVFFYREGNRIYFVNMKPESKPDEVVIKLILGISSLGFDDPLNIPADMEKGAIEYVVQLYSNYQPSDTTNDNVDRV